VTTRAIIEIAIAAALIVAGIWIYRRRAADGQRYGSQSAVLMFVAAAILLIDGLGLVIRARESWL
jgi:hypothetical protein